MTITDYQHNERDDLAMAAFSLALSKPSSSTAGDRPNDAELAALIENQLDDTRKAQVIGYIANDNDVYVRWIQLVDAMAYLDELQESGTEDSTALAEKQTLSEKFKDFFTLKSFGAYGGGFATAAIALLIVFALPVQELVNVSNGIDGAYSQWGNSLSKDWADAPESVKPAPQFSGKRKFSFTPVVKSETRKVMETGFKSGSSRIEAYPYRAFGINPRGLAEVSKDQIISLSSDEFTLLHETGRLAALTSMQCVVDANSSRVIKLYPVARTLVNKLSDSSISELSSSIANFSRTKNKAEAVCSLSANLLNYLTTTKKQ